MEFRSVCFVLAAAITVMLGGCASGPKRAPLYEWGVYPQLLHEDLKKGVPPEQQLQTLERQREAMEKAGLPMPPGMAMHLGLLYQRLGQNERAKQYLDLEAQRYPSLRGFIDWLQQQGRGSKADEKA